jgi:hypothetical protein
VRNPEESNTVLPCWESGLAPFTARRHVLSLVVVIAVPPVEHRPGDAGDRVEAETKRGGVSTSATGC